MQNCITIPKESTLANTKNIMLRQINLQESPNHLQMATVMGPPTIRDDHQTQVTMDLAMEVLGQI